MTSGCFLPANVAGKGGYAWGVISTAFFPPLWENVPTSVYAYYSYYSLDTSLQLLLSPQTISSMAMSKEQMVAACEGLLARAQEAGLNVPGESIVAQGGGERVGGKTARGGVKREEGSGAWTMREASRPLFRLSENPRLPPWSSILSFCFEIRKFNPTIKGRTCGNNEWASVSCFFSVGTARVAMT